MSTRKNRKIILLSEEEKNNDNKDDKNLPRESFISSKVIKNYRKVLTDGDNLTRYIENNVCLQEKKLTKNEIKLKENVKKDEKEIEVIDLNSDDDDDFLNIENKLLEKTSLEKKLNPTQKPIEDDCMIIEKDDNGDKKPNKSLDLSFELNDLSYEQVVENTSMRIKIKRLDRIEIFSLLPIHPISKILDEISQRFDIPVPRIILYLNDEIVDVKETPKSLNLSVADIFEILCRNDATSNNSTNQSINTDPNFIKLVLHDNSKNKISCNINRFEYVRKLAEIYSKEKNVPIDKFILQFDQETISLDSKIDCFDLEDNDQIDVIVKS